MSLNYFRKEKKVYNRKSKIAAKVQDFCQVSMPFYEGIEVNSLSIGPGSLRVACATLG